MCRLERGLRQEAAFGKWAVMRLPIGVGGKLAGSVALCGLMALGSVSRGEVRSSGAAVSAEVPIVWQRHQMRFSYVGFTTLYACDALESQVRRILAYLGARADLKVTARCSQPLLPTRQAVIDADFYAPILADGISADVGTGRWTPVGLEAGHPRFIGAGDCELIEDMKALVTASFSWRNVDYRTSCFPNELTLHDFGVKGEALKVKAAP